MSLFYLFVLFTSNVIRCDSFSVINNKLFSKILLSGRFSTEPKSINNYYNYNIKENSVKFLSFFSFFIANKVKAEDKTKLGKLEYQPALQGLDYGKPRTYYPDFVQKPSGLQYKVVKEGEGKSPKVGDRVTVDWEGYTIGYYGRPFQTRNKVKGGAFDSAETDFFRYVIGSGSAIGALDEGGGITQIIVPAELGYPAKGDSEHDLVGPKPTNFSGQRALNFVLDNQNLIDKTLLINIRLVKVDEGYADRKKK